MSFDQEPDAPLHGECAAEIARLQTELATARAEVYAECARICANEHLLNPTDSDGDIAYDNAVRDCRNAIERAAATKTSTKP